MVKIKELKGLKRSFTLKNGTVLVLKPFENKDISNSEVTETMKNACGLREISITDIPARNNNNKATNKEGGVK